MCQSLNEQRTLFDLIDKWKNELCARAICDAKDLCSEWGVAVSRRIK
jgi:hypothetical protein